MRIVILFGSQGVEPHSKGVKLKRGISITLDLPDLCHFMLL